MKHMIVAASLLSATFLFACGTDKKEKKVPVAVVNPDADSTVPAQDPARCDDDVSQNQNCGPAVPVGELRVVKESSWLNPDFDDNGRLQDDDGACLDVFKAGRRDANGLASLDMQLKNMDLKRNAARCRMQIRVAYTKGYAFAIRRVEARLMTEIPADSRAIFEGSYRIQGKAPVVMQKSLESRYTDKPLLLDYSVANQDIVWSSCSGQATLVVDTKLSMDFTRSGRSGDIRMEGKSPYRMDIIWAKCQ